MINNIVIGTNFLKTKFELIEDEYGNKFFSNGDIHQRIRLGKKVNPHIGLITSNKLIIKDEPGPWDSESFDTQVVSDSYEVTNVPHMISNSHTNMNINLMNFFSKDKKVMENHVNDNIAYLIINTNEYELLDYRTNHEIIQTFKSRNNPGDETQTYLGCAIKYLFDNEDKYNDTKLIELTLKNIKARRYLKFSLYVSQDGRTDILKHDDISYKRLKHAKPRTFRFRVKDNTMITNTFVTDKYNYNECVKLVADKRDAKVIILDENDPESVSSLKDTLFNARVRAVTEYGIKISPEIRRECKLLYLFELIKKEDGHFFVRCVKSN